MQLLEAIAREWLVKTQQAEKRLSCSDLLIVEISGVAVIACNSKLCL
jgi:hypothetical protein